MRVTFFSNTLIDTDSVSAKKRGATVKMLAVFIEKKKTLSSITLWNTESNGNGFLIIFLYVDDLIYLGNDQMTKDFKKQMTSRF